jgi:hypothetical protein
MTDKPHGLASSLTNYGDADQSGGHSKAEQDGVNARG